MSPAMRRSTCRGCGGGIAAPGVGQPAPSLPLSLTARGGSISLSRPCSAGRMQSGQPNRRLGRTFSYCAKRDGSTVRMALEFTAGGRLTDVRG